MELDFVLISDISIANAIRRTIVDNIPSYAIDTVCIEENDNKLMSDEILAHRLGQIPLVYDINLIESYQISLHEVGPKKIYSRDIKFPKYVKAVSDDILIMELKNNEVIKLTGEINQGIGAQHAKWSVACGVYYIQLEKNKFKFHVETNGTYTAKEAVIKSVDILKNELGNIKQLLNKQN
jgi:DNA-directed RNA polymerase subunit D